MRERDPLRSAQVNFYFLGKTALVPLWPHNQGQKFLKCHVQNGEHDTVPLSILRFILQNESLLNIIIMTNKE